MTKSTNPAKPQTVTVNRVGAGDSGMARGNQVDVLCCQWPGMQGEVRERLLDAAVAAPT